MKFTLNEVRVAKELFSAGKRLEERIKNLTFALNGFSDVDLSSAFDEELAHIKNAIIYATNILPIEWNEDLIYDVISGDIDIHTFFKFAVKSEEERKLYAYNSRDGYYVISENPQHEELAKFFNGGTGE